jgi:hypothetical protein
VAHSGDLGIAICRTFSSCHSMGHPTRMNRKEKSMSAKASKRALSMGRIRLISSIGTLCRTEGNAAGT